MQPESYEPSVPRDFSEKAPTERDALARVVIESLGQLAQSQQLPCPSIAPFVAVAKKYEGVPFSPDPIGRELVEEALISLFGRDGPATEAWRWVGAQVSRTLHDNPGSRALLVQFWSRLQQRDAAVKG
jgi:hypothetical protein